jgi:hypothetical protein
MRGASLEEPRRRSGYELTLAEVASKRQSLPPVHADHILETACDRVGGGHLSQAGRWEGMTLGMAQKILTEAILELIALRSERRELVCSKCLAIYIQEPNHVLRVCPTCNGILRSKSMVVEASLRERISELEQKIVHLEASLTVVLDLDLEDAREPNPPPE